MSLTLYLARNGDGLVVESTPGHLITVPLTTDRQRAQATKLFEHLLQAQADEKAAQRHVAKLGAKSAPTQGIVDAFMKAHPDAMKRVGAKPPKPVFDPSEALKKWGLIGPGPVVVTTTKENA